MNKKKFLFVDHSYHRHTRSSFFFKELLRKEFLLEEVYIDPESGEELLGILESGIANCDGVILWQIDYLATYFLSRRIPTVVIPMCDASAALNPEHWRVMKGALFISFSLELHWLISAANGNSMYVKYFPPISKLRHLRIPFDPARGADKLKVFFWERRPNDGINTKSVLRLLGSSTASIHVHQAVDPGQHSTTINEHDYPNIDFFYSSWFDTKDDYISALNKCDVFVAPRYSEGIGLGFLEAMSLGKLVIAHDSATHNEYISNWHNGILTNFYKQTDSIDVRIKDISVIASNAYIDSGIAAEIWERSYSSAILESLHRCIDSRGFEGCHGHWPSICYSPEFFRNLCAAHRDFSKYYSTIERLLDAQSRLGVSFRDRIQLNPSHANLSVRQAYRLVAKKQYNEALEFLLDRSKQFDSPSPYLLIHDQLKALFELKGLI